MPTKLAQEIHAWLKAAKDPKILVLDEPETRMPWPGETRSIWPFADLSGGLVTGERFIIEIDDHADPGRSIVKYWPLLHAVSTGAFEYPPIRFMEVSSPDSTFGQGFELLAQFIGKRLAEQYPGRFHFAYTSLAGKSSQEIGAEVLAFLNTGLARAANSTPGVGIPSDLSLPYFAYGSFKPDELAHGLIRQFVRGEARVTHVQGCLRVRDGLPLLDPAAGGKIKGYAMTFCAEGQDAAYAAIGQFEPKGHYEWAVVPAGEKVCDS